MANFPDFKTKDEEITFWESNDSADFWDEMEDIVVDVDLHHNLHHPRLVVLAYLPERCPRCSSELESVTIEYITNKDGQLSIIRDVPAWRCHDIGHEYILEETLNQIERLLSPEPGQPPHPFDMLQVPIFSLQTAS